MPNAARIPAKPSKSVKPGMSRSGKPVDIRAQLGDGLVASAQGESWPMPLAATEIEVEIVGGLGIVRTTRRFRNAEARAIEATITFPVPGDAALTGLRASIDGRDLVAAAKASAAARETYEAALDDGKTAILHEEKMRGVHMLSLGNLPPGKEASVTVTFVAALTFAGPTPTLRIPTSVGEIFGRSPLIASDDIVTGDVRHVAKVRVTGDGAPQILATGATESELPLDGSIVIAVPGFRASESRGRAADGAPVRLTIDRLGEGDADLDLTILVDRSGSTGDPLETDSGVTKAWTVITRGLRAVLGRDLRPSDRIRLYHYGSDVRPAGEATGVEAARLVDGIVEPDGGTRTALALTKVMTDHAGDVLLVTDGRSHFDVGALAARTRRVTAVLVGPGAFDAQVGQLAALSGGQLFACPGDLTEETLRSALASLRLPSGNMEGPRRTEPPRELRAARGGAAIEASWGDPVDGEGADDVGRYAAALALPLLTDEAALALSLSHGLCTHLTSLVMVDDAGERQQGIPANRKVPLMRSGSTQDALFALEQASAGVGSPMRSSGLFKSGGSPLRSLMAERSMLPRFSASPPDAVFTSDRAADEPRKSARGPKPVYGSSAGKSASPRMPTQARPARGKPLDLDGFLGRPGPDAAPSPAPMPAPGPAFGPLDLSATAGRVDWDAVAPALAVGWEATLTGVARAMVVRIAALPAVAALATALGAEPRLVALALLASSAKDDRTAARVARRILSGAPEAELGAARAAVGL